MQIADETIKIGVVEHLLWDDRVDASDIKVEVSDGTVILSGTVDSPMAAEAAKSDAYAVRGVIYVKMNTETRSSPMLEIPSDGEIEIRIRSIFSWDANINSENINISIADGEVTLEGTVDAYWKKGLAENLILSTVGIVAIRNNLAVVPTKDVSDELIAQAIVAALERSSSVDVDKIGVEVERRVVKLSGAVPTWAAYLAALETAKYTGGVTEIINNITIGPQGYPK